MCTVYRVAGIEYHTVYRCTLSAARNAVETALTIVVFPDKTGVFHSPSTSALVIRLSVCPPICLSVCVYVLSLFLSCLFAALAVVVVVVVVAMVMFYL